MHRRHPQRLIQRSTKGAEFVIALLIDAGLTPLRLLEIELQGLRIDVDSQCGDLSLRGAIRQPRGEILAVIKHEIADFAQPSLQTLRRHLVGRQVNRVIASNPLQAVVRAHQDKARIASYFPGRDGMEAQATPANELGQPRNPRFRPDVANAFQRQALTGQRSLLFTKDDRSSQVILHEQPRPHGIDVRRIPLHDVTPLVMEDFADGKHVVGGDDAHAQGPGLLEQCADAVTPLALVDRAQHRVQRRRELPGQHIAIDVSLHLAGQVFQIEAVDRLTRKFGQIVDDEFFAPNIIMRFTDHHDRYICRQLPDDVTGRSLGRDVR